MYKIVYIEKILMHLNKVGRITSAFCEKKLVQERKLQFCISHLLILHFNEKTSKFIFSLWKIYKMVNSTKE